MIKIATKSLLDLEFPTVCKQISELCITQMGIDKSLEITPYKTFKKTILGLNRTNEYVSSYQQDSRIPNHGFDSIHKEIKMLGIDGSILELGSFKKISSLSETANTQIRFFNKFQELYPSIYETTETVEYTKVITEQIDKIFNR
ncbi:MAG: DNA mismatch repair protein MutS, partial [Gillisia sp.]